MTESKRIEVLLKAAAGYLDAGEIEACHEMLGLAAATAKRADYVGRWNKIMLALRYVARIEVRS